MCQGQTPGEIDLAVYGKGNRIVLFDPIDLVPVSGFRTDKPESGTYPGPMRLTCVFFFEGKDYSILFDQTREGSEVEFYLREDATGAVYREDREVGEPGDGVPVEEDPGEHGWVLLSRLLHCEGEFCGGEKCPVFTSCRYEYKAG